MYTSIKFFLLFALLLLFSGLINPQSAEQTIPVKDNSTNDSIFLRKIYDEALSNGQSYSNL